MRVSDKMAAVIFLGMILFCVGAAFRKPVMDLYNDRAAQRASQVIPEDLRKLQKQEDGLGVTRCQKLPRVSNLEESWTCTGAFSDGTIKQVVFDQSTFDGRACSVTIVKLNESIEKRVYTGDGLHVKRKTVIEDIQTGKKSKGETVEELDPSTCLYFFQQVKLAM